MQVCLHDTSIKIYTTFQHMKGASFCIHRTCLCHWVFELPLSHLSPCSAIHFIFLSLGMDALSPPQLRLCRLWVLSLHYVMCAMTRMSEVVIYKFNNPPSPVLRVLLSLRWFPLVLELVITQMFWGFFLRLLCVTCQHFSSLCFLQLLRASTRWKATESFQDAQLC